MSKRIIAIDDEADVLQIIKAALITRNYEVTTTTSGQEGIDLVSSEKPDLVICDLMMPRVSGLAVLKALKSNPEVAQIPIIILSALGGDDRPPEFWIKTLGVDDYVQKPFDPLDLLGRVEYIFRKASYISHKPGWQPTRTPEPATRQARFPRDTPEDANATRTPIDLKENSPDQVVAAFIDCYNRQDFATEFQCLDPEMTGGEDQRSYVERRRQMFLDEKATGRTQRLLEVVEQKVSINVARVTIEREDTVAGESKSKRESYMLKKTYLGWKIIGMRAVKPAVNPVQE